MEPVLGTGHSESVNNGTSDLTIVGLMVKPH